MFRKRPSAIVLLPALLLSVCALPFALSDLDLTISARFFDPETGSWPLDTRQPWLLLNMRGVYPGAMVAIGAIVALFGTIGNRKLVRHRRIPAYIMWATLIGPGIIINLILKGRWGRPRPIDTSDFGGTSDFERLLHFDPTSPGRSFSSGHASMGFIFVSVGFALLAIGRRRSAIAVMIGSLLYGFFIGGARIVSGAHYPSDVIASGIIVWLTSAALYFAFRLHQSPYQASAHLPLPPAHSVRPRYAICAIVGLTLFTTFFWPEKQSSHRRLSPAADTPVALHLDLEGSLEIRHADTAAIHTRVAAVGFPKAGLVAVPSQKSGTLVLTHHRTGILTGVTARSILTLPPGLRCTISVGDRLASVSIDPATENASAGLIKILPRTAAATETSPIIPVAVATEPALPTKPRSD